MAKNKQDRDNEHKLRVQKLLDSSYTDKSKQDNKNEVSIDLFEQGFEVLEPKAPRILTSKKLIQAHGKFMQKLKGLDYTIHGQGVPEYIEKIIGAGLNSVLTRAGFYSANFDKGGAAFNAAGIGDGYYVFGTQKEGFPFTCMAIPNNNVFFNSKASGIRSGNNPADEGAYILEYSKEDFHKMYPKAPKDTKGPIPRQYRPRGKNVNQTVLQGIVGQPDEDTVEVCKYYCLSKKLCITVAGSEMNVCEVLEGKDYPNTFTDKSTGQKGKPYIPIFGQVGPFLSFRGFYNGGIFHVGYDLVRAYSSLLNKGVLHAEDQADPPQLLSVPKGSAQTVLQSLAMAKVARANGQRPIIPVGYDATDTGQVSLNSLVSAQSIEEINYFLERLDLEFKRLGIFLDENYDPNTTATQILSEDENSVMSVKQMMEYNSYEFEFFLRVVLSCLETMIKSSNKTPLDLTTAVYDDEGSLIDTSMITLGMVADEIRSAYFFPKVNKRTGAIAPRLRMEQINRMMPFAQPGTKAQMKLIASLSDINDMDIKPSEFFEPSSAVPPQGESPEVAPLGGSPTDRMTINPRQTVQTPVI